MGVNTSCLKQALTELQLPYQIVGASQVMVAVPGREQPLLFIANITPFNNEVVVKIAHDKSFTHDLLANVVPMPRTQTYMDPQAEEMFQPYVRFHTQVEIVADIEQHFSYPLVIKKNSGSRGELVTVVPDKAGLAAAVAAVFNQQSRHYDYLLLAQERLAIEREWRVVVWQQKIAFWYEKDISQATFAGNLSPLHWSQARAVLKQDAQQEAAFYQLLTLLFAQLDVVYGGLDIAQTKDGRLYLLEINTQPGYTMFVRDNGPAAVVALYKQMLLHANLVN